MTHIYHFHPVTPNIGNDLIVLATHYLIKKIQPGSLNIINIPAKGTHSSIKTGGIGKSIVHDINQIGDGVLIGPGNIFENNGLDIDPQALNALMKPSMLFSVSWGRIYNNVGILHPRTDAMNRDNIQRLCGLTESILVRDDVTREYLETLGIHNSKVIGCPVLTLDPKTLLLPSPNPDLSDTVLISVRNPNLMNIPPRLQGRLYVDIYKIINELKKLGHNKIAILCHDFRDIRFASAFTGYPILYTESPLEFLSWLKQCKLNVTFRLHSFLPCAVFGVPSVHFTYDERAAGLISTSHLNDCEVNFLNTPDPVQKAMELIASPEPLIQYMQTAKRHWQVLQDIMKAEVEKWLLKMEML